MPSRRSTALLACLASALLIASSAAAEGFFDIYAGAGFIQDGDVDATTDNPGVDISYNSDVDFETSPSFGLRGGYWFEDATRFLGIGLDLSYYRAFEDSSFAPLDIWAFPLTPLLMLRIPIATEEGMPGGRVQPYAAVGPGFTISGARSDLDDFAGVFDDFEAASFDVGLDARGGLAIQLTRRLAMFGEYRFTWLEPEYEDDDLDSVAGEFDAEIEPELRTHHLVFGLSLRF